MWHYENLATKQKKKMKKKRAGKEPVCVCVFSVQQHCDLSISEIFHCLFYRVNEAFFCQAFAQIRGVASTNANTLGLRKGWIVIITVLHHHDQPGSIILLVVPHHAFASQSKPCYIMQVMQDFLIHFKSWKLAKAYVSFFFSAFANDSPGLEVDAFWMLFPPRIWSRCCRRESDGSSSWFFCMGTMICRTCLTNGCSQYLTVLVSCQGRAGDSRIVHGSGTRLLSACVINQDSSYYTWGNRGTVSKAFRLCLGANIIQCI